MTSGLVDGSVLIGDVGEPLRRLLAQVAPSFPWISIDEPSRFCILADSRHGVSQIVRRLVELGHRRLAYACGPQRYFTHHEGFAGWEQSIEQLGLSIPAGRNFVFGGDEQEGICSEGALEWATHLLKQPDRPTAFVCHDMVIARAVIYAAVQMGLSVPRDLSVTSWGWHIAAQEQYPALSTVELDYRVMMERGLELLNRLIDQDPITELRVMVAPRYVEGATIAPPPA